MKSVYIREIGIHPWDQIYSSIDKKFITITLINQTFEDVWKTWCEFSLPLIRSWPTIIQWSTTLTPAFSRTEEYLDLKNFKKNCMTGDILRKNEKTSIYSQVIRLNSSPSHIDPARMTNYSSSVTLMQPSTNDLEKVWHRLSYLRHISTTEDFKIILFDNMSLSFRFYDTETHGAAQLICHSEHAQLLNEIIATMEITEIQQDDVYTYIHSE